ncbi:dihydroneopterin aldolase [Alteribacillus sp. HJP-4]|uniref:dihydroneopterin aldolase n=1 Tax=Alteribacillus sp. HJP-4 TaxID=2775394 RepID=UPI0035CD1155
MDKIHMQGMEFYAYHGVFSEENKLGQRFRVDIVMEADLREAAAEDNIEKSINYAEAYEAVKDVVEKEQYDLVETIAEGVAANLFKNFSILKRVNVKVIKPDPPIPGHYDHVAIEIVRGRQ